MRLFGELLLKDLLLVDFGVRSWLGLLVTLIILGCLVLVLYVWLMCLCILCYNSDDCLPVVVFACCYY